MKKIVLFVISSIALIITLGSTWAYDIPYSGIVSDEWVNSDSGSEVINGINYTWVTFDANLSGIEIITYYSLNELYDTLGFESEFHAIEYVSSDNGLNKIGIHSNTLGNHNIYHGYTRDFRVYMNQSILTLDPTEVVGVFLSKYFKQFSGNITQFINAINQSVYDNGYIDGYYNARSEYGYYNGSNWITATVHGSNRYDTGLNESKEFYGIFYDNLWLTAEQYGQIRYNEGYELGLTNEIDWFNWAFTFITMPVRILNVEVLPGIKIGYFALFTLMTGIVSWFFFIVGKGGRKK